LNNARASLKRHEDFLTQAVNEKANKEENLKLWQSLVCLQFTLNSLSIVHYQAGTIAETESSAKSNNNNNSNTTPKPAVDKESEKTMEVEPAVEKPQLTKTLSKPGLMKKKVIAHSSIELRRINVFYFVLCIFFLFSYFAIVLFVHCVSQI
jgi:hypothetical protein